MQPSVHQRRCVSILVFLELALGLTSRVSPASAWQVSILVFLELALGRFCAGYWLHIVPVSILVFLELALGPMSWWRNAKTRLSFNPCFLGTCPRTFTMHYTISSAYCFNPCFLGTCPRTMIPPMGSTFLESFNPCFLGTCPRTPILLAIIASDKQFQSLFSWNLPSD